MMRNAFYTAATVWFWVSVCVGVGYGAGFFLYPLWWVINTIVEVIL